VSGFSRTSEVRLKGGHYEIDNTPYSPKAMILGPAAIAMYCLSSNM
jgi:hypothetical protein